MSLLGTLQRSRRVKWTNTRLRSQSSSSLSSTTTILTSIYRYEDLVVQDNFRFGDDKEIVCLLLLFHDFFYYHLIFFIDRRAAERCSLGEQEGTQETNSYFARSSCPRKSLGHRQFAVLGLSWPPDSGLFSDDFFRFALL